MQHNNLYNEQCKTRVLIGSSIGNGGINTKCAKTTNMKKCAKIPRSNISGMPRSNPKVKNFRNAKVKYFRNPKVKYFRNAKVKSQDQIFQECQGQIPRSNGKIKMGNRKKPEKTGKMGKCNKNKKPKTLKEILILY